MVSSIWQQQKTAAEANTFNDAGGKAYKLTAEESLAQLALTGTFNDTFYARAEKQLDRLKVAASSCTPAFVGQTAVYARKHGLMKDTPVALLAWLVANNFSAIARQVAPLVLDNGKQLRNFVQMMRSGQFGRKSLGTVAKKIVQERLLAMGGEDLLWASVGNNPSLGDVIKLSHPKPNRAWQEGAFGHLTGKQVAQSKLLPASFRSFEKFKQNRADNDFPNLPIEAITPLLQSDYEWQRFAREGNLGLLAVLKNLNSFERHGVFRDEHSRQRILELIRKGGRVMPYQIMTSLAMTEALDSGIRTALEAALESSLAEVPSFGRVIIGIDVSSSMQNPITGHQAGRPDSKVSCRDVAALIGAAFIAKSESGLIVPFDDKPQNVQLSASIAGNARALASIGGGSTDCSIPLGVANQANIKADVVVMVSDNESWKDVSASFDRYGRTVASSGLSQQWEIFKRSNPNAKLICIDLTPNTTTQATRRPDTLNVGGFSDSVFTVIRDFVSGTSNLVDSIKSLS